MAVSSLDIVRTFDRVAVDRSALARFEVNRCAQRRLDPQLRLVDLALQRWAPWARPTYGTGYPTRSVTERANEGGILAKDSCLPYPPEWPAVVVQVDRHVAELPTRHMAAVFANYFHMTLPAEQRAALYASLSRHLARTRPTRPPGAKANLGRATFASDLDRARWTLKFALRV